MRQSRAVVASLCASLSHRHAACVKRHKDESQPSHGAVASSLFRGMYIPVMRHRTEGVHGTVGDTASRIEENTYTTFTHGTESLSLYLCSDKVLRIFISLVKNIYILKLFLVTTLVMNVSPKEIIHGYRRRKKWSSKECIHLAKVKDNVSSVKLLS